MLKKIVIAGIVSGVFAKALNSWMRRITAQQHEQEVDVQRWEDEGGQAGGVDADRTREAHASEL